ncbi:FtsX-like permease family protein [Demequina subtropica]|uniref:FtsX-like permease family protein n=1 Tax=Demequina subtropica TaxID=1638989 RepID=UPI0007814EA2|nr:ABC transporter permease [Demequina subtropica]
MIRQLMREQARAQRAYLSWTGGFIAVTVAIVAFVGVIALQQFRVVAYAEGVFGLDGEWTRSIELGQHYDALGDAPTLDELDRVLDSADADGAVTSGLHEVTGLGFWLPGATEFDEAGFPAARMAAEPAGVRGAIDWDALLIEGDAPSYGEVVLDASWAEGVGVAVGDTVAAMWNGELADGPAWDEAASLMVSGLMRTSSEGRYGSREPLALLDWEQSFDLGDRDHVEVAAQRSTPDLEALAGWPGSPSFEADTSAARWTVLGLTALVLAIGLAGMAFAAGRAQAQARTRWVATARVLGARTSAIVAATVAEVLAVGMIAGLGGLAIGWGAARIDWALYVGAHADALLPAAPALDPWLAGAGLTLALVLAGIVGGIPAFWASRVEPVAALKPVSPVTTGRSASAYRPIGLHLAWAASLAAVALTIMPTLLDSSRLGFVGPLVPGIGAVCAVAAGLLSVAVVVSWSRRAAALAGRRLVRSARPWALSAGLALEGRPRQASGPAAVLGVAAAVLVGVQTWAALYVWSQGGGYNADAWPASTAWFPDALLYPQFAYSGLSLIPAVAALSFGALTLVALGSHLATARAHRDDAIAQGALGLTRRDARLANALVLGVPIALAILIGAAMGIVVAVASFAGYDTGTVEEAAPGIMMPRLIGPLWALGHVSHAIIPVAGVVLIGLAWIAAASALAAALTPIGSRERVAA